MVFSAVSRVSSFEADNGTDDSVGTGQGKKMYASLCHIDAVRSRMKVELGKLYTRTDLSKQKWNSPVSCSQRSYLGGGGGGCWQ